MNQKPRTEDDLRAAFQLAAQDAPDRESVLRRVFDHEPPVRPRRLYPILAPIGAVAAVLLAVGVLFLVVHSSNSGGTSSSAAKAESVAGGNAYQASSSAAAAGGVVHGPELPSPTDATASSSPGSLSVCRPDQVSLTLVWTENGVELTGTLTATNTGGIECGLLVRPAVTPLGAGGQPLTVRNAQTTDQPVGPQGLLPGASATSSITWNFWCGMQLAGTAQVSWGAGTATATVQHDPFTQPHAACPQNTNASAITSTWFSPLS